MLILKIDIPATGSNSINKRTHLHKNFKSNRIEKTLQIRYVNGYVLNCNRDIGLGWFKRCSQTVQCIYVSGG